jgi:hypothetical protein
VLLRLVLWNLADSKTSVGELRRYLVDESVDRFAEVAGLRFKAWASDDATERWGAVYLWESAEAARRATRSGLARARAHREGSRHRRGVRRRGHRRAPVRDRAALAARARVRA